MKSKKKVLSSLFSLLSPSFSTPFFSYRNGQVHRRSYAITAILYNGIVICALLLPIGIQTYKSQLRSIKKEKTAYAVDNMATAVIFSYLLLIVLDFRQRITDIQSQLM